MPLARRKSSRKSGDRRNELTMQERYLDVKDFWLKQSEARQRELLHVPIRALLQGLCRSSTVPKLIQRMMCDMSVRALSCVRRQMCGSGRHMSGFAVCFFILLLPQMCLLCLRCPNGAWPGHSRRGGAWAGSDEGLRQSESLLLDLPLLHECGGHPAPV